MSETATAVELREELRLHGVLGRGPTTVLERAIAALAAAERRIAELEKHAAEWPRKLRGLPALLRDLGEDDVADSLVADGIEECGDDE